MSDNYFSPTSLAELATADPRLGIVARKVLLIKDHSVIKGHRGQVEQNQAFEDGHSKLRWPDGKHNKMPSKAIDVRTYPVPPDEREQMVERRLEAGLPPDERDLREEQLYLLGLYVGVASEMGLRLLTGADWDRDGEIADTGFDDFFHVELVE